MAVENIYKYAAEHKLRFPFAKGLINTEDLFSLDVKQLDAIYKSLRRQAKTDEEESLLSEKAADTELAVKIEIVKDIFNDKQTAAEARKNAAEKRARNQKIAAIIAEKEDADLRNKSMDELRGMLEE